MESSDEYFMLQRFENIPYVSGGVVKNSCFRCTETLAPFQEQKIIDEKQPVQEIVLVNCNS
jgi:hypothetical protein